MADYRSTLDALGPGWWENKATGLVYAQGASELRFACWFPEVLSRRSLLVAELVVADRQGAWVGSCRVTYPFAPLFTGRAQHYHFGDGVFFDDVGGHEWETKADLAPEPWIRLNVRAIEALHGAVVRDQARLRDDVLPAADLASGTIARIVKDYRFRASEFPDNAAATAEFCRRFAYKDAFATLFHPDVSVRRFFDAAARATPTP